jgi:hypothetical protein
MMRNRLPALAAAVLGILLSTALAVAAPADEAVRADGGDAGSDGGSRAFGVEITPDFVASEIEPGGSAIYYTFVTNTGDVTDVITVDITHDEMPDGVTEWDWFANYCDESICHTGPWDYTLGPGESQLLDVHLDDFIGTATGLSVMTLTAVSNGDPGADDAQEYATFVGVPSILIVDDDGGANDEDYIEDAVTDAGYYAYTYDGDNDGIADVCDADAFRIALWTTGGGDATYVTGATETIWMNYLDDGGSFFLASAEYLSTRGGPTTFTTDYLHLDGWNNDVGGSLVTGVPGDAISDGMVLPLGTTVAVSDDSWDPPSFPAESFFDVFTSTEGVKGLRGGEDGHMIAFIPFAFENVSTVDADPNNQKTLIGRVIDWFDPTDTGVEGGVGLARASLKQNYPNPFNPTTTIEFAVPAEAGHVNLVVYNANGQVVKTLVDGRVSPGPQSVVWDGKDGAGQSLGSGIYFARLTADGETAFRKMTLLK